MFISTYGMYVSGYNQVIHGRNARCIHTCTRLRCSQAPKWQYSQHSSQRRTNLFGLRYTAVQKSWVTHTSFRSERVLRATDLQKCRYERVRVWVALHHVTHPSLTVSPFALLTIGYQDYMVFHSAFRNLLRPLTWSWGGFGLVFRSLRETKK
jgi:hypothetical protein